MQIVYPSSNCSLHTNDKQCGCRTIEYNDIKRDNVGDPYCFEYALHNDCDDEVAAISISTNYENCHLLNDHGWHPISGSDRVVVHELDRGSSRPFAVCFDDIDGFVDFEIAHRDEARCNELEIDYFCRSTDVLCDAEHIVDVVFLVDVTCSTPSNRDECPLWRQFMVDIVSSIKRTNQNPTISWIEYDDDLMQFQLEDDSDFLSFYETLQSQECRVGPNGDDQSNHLQIGLEAVFQHFQQKVVILSNCLDGPDIVDVCNQYEALQEMEVFLINLDGADMNMVFDEQSVVRKHQWIALELGSLPN